MFKVLTKLNYINILTREKTLLTYFHDAKNLISYGKREGATRYVNVVLPFNQYLNFIPEVAVRVWRV